MTRSSSFFQRCFVGLLALLTAVATSLAAVPPELREALKVISDPMVAAQQDRSDDYLGRIPGALEFLRGTAGHEKLSPYGKIGVVVSGAEEAAPGSGARLAAALRAAIAVDQPTIANDPELRGLPTPPEGPIAFKRPSAAMSSASLRADLRPAVAALASHVADDASLSVDWLLRHAGATTDEVLEAVWETPRSIADALERVLAPKPAAVQERMVRSMVQLVTAQRPTALNDPRIERFRPKTAVTPSSQGQRRKRSPAYDALVRKRTNSGYTNTYRRWRNAPPNLSTGGILFGNDVHAPSPITSLDVSSGLSITVSGDRYTLPRVSKDDACVATKLAANDAHGIVSLTHSQLTNLEHVLVHPALIDTDVAAVLVDVDDKIFALASIVPAGAPPALRAPFAMSARHGSKRRVRQIVDEPIALSFAHGAIVARSNASSALFSIVEMDEDGKKSPEAIAWSDSLRPVLVLLLTDGRYLRMNDFIAAYAVARRAKADGVKMPACEPAFVPTPDVIDSGKVMSSRQVIEGSCRTISAGVGRRACEVVRACTLDVQIDEPMYPTAGQLAALELKARACAKKGVQRLCQAARNKRQCRREYQTAYDDYQ